MKRFACFKLTELIERVDEKTELATFMAEVGRVDCSSALLPPFLHSYALREVPMQVVTQFKIADSKKFDKTISTEDQLAALG